MMAPLLNWAGTDTVRWLVHALRRAAGVCKLVWLLRQVRSLPRPNAWRLVIYVGVLASALADLGPLSARRNKRTGAFIIDIF